jgi:hypothetical protein
MNFRDALRASARIPLAAAGISGIHVRPVREGGEIPDKISDELNRSTCRECGSNGAPRVSIRDHRSGQMFIGCLECAAQAISSRADVAFMVSG